MFDYNHTLASHRSCEGHNSIAGRKNSVATFSD
jgi:hypothetical protein